jgi:hypothetical protein
MIALSHQQKPLVCPPSLKTNGGRRNDTFSGRLHDQVGYTHIEDILLYSPTELHIGGFGGGASFSFGVTILAIMATTTVAIAMGGISDN